MDEMIRYIFGSLRCSETAMRVFAKTLRKQRSFNRSTVMVATVMTVHMLIQDLEIRSIQLKSQQVIWTTKSLSKNRKSKEEFQNE